MLLVASACQNAPHGLGWHDSPLALSLHKLPILPPPSDLKLSLRGRAIRASWRPGAILPFNKYNVTVTTAVGEAVALTGTPSFALVNGLVTALVEPKVDEYIEGHNVTVSVFMAEDALPLTTPTVRLVAKASILYQPTELLITDESAYDTKSQILTIVVERSAGNFLPGTQFSWHRATDSTSGDPKKTGGAGEISLLVFNVADMTIGSCRGRRAVLRIRPPKSTVGHWSVAGLYTIRATELVATDGFIVSKIWQLSQDLIARDLSIGKFSAITAGEPEQQAQQQQSSGSLIKLSWEKGSADTDVEVQLSLYYSPAQQQEQQPIATPADGANQAHAATSSIPSTGASTTAAAAAVATAPSFKMVRVSVPASRLSYVLGEAKGEILPLPGTFMTLSYVVRGKHLAGQTGRVVIAR